MCFNISWDRLHFILREAQVKKILKQSSNS